MVDSTVQAIDKTRREALSQTFDLIHLHFHRAIHRGHETRRAIRKYRRHRPQRLA